MDTTLMTQIAARVVAWHNRHPLARRITAAQVRSIGVVALPFARITTPEAAQVSDTEPPAGRLAALRAHLPTRLRALLHAPWQAWQARRMRRQPPRAADLDGLQAVFDEDFIGGLPPGLARRWADRHATKNRPGEEDWPRRDVPVDAHLLEAVLNAAPAPALDEPRADGSAADDAPVAGAGLRYALTAAIELDGVRHRLLLNTAPRPAVLGRRAFSPLRLAALGGLIAALTTAALLRPWLGPGASAASTVASAAFAAASGPVHANAPASAPTPAARSAALAASDAASQALPAGHGSASDSAAATGAAASAPSASASASASASTDGRHHAAPAAHDPQANHASPPPESASTAGHTSAVAPADAARLAARLPTQAPSPSQPEGSPHRPGTLPGAPGPAAGPVFALVSRSATSQAEPLVALERLKLAAAPLEASLPGTRVELLQQGGRWSAVWWPFPSRADASQARWAAALKGVTVDVVEF